MVSFITKPDNLFDLRNLTLDYYRGRYKKLFSSLIFVIKINFFTILVDTTVFSGFSSFYTYILLDGVMQYSMRFETFFPLYFLFCKILQALQDVITCNVSGFLDSRPFQQAIIWRNSLRNRFKRAILTWELFLQYFKSQSKIFLSNSPRRWSYSKCSPELITQSISSNYSLLERFWIKESRYIRSDYIL